MGTCPGCGKNEDHEQARLVAQGDKLFEEGRYHQAIMKWNEALQPQKDSKEILYKIATANEKQGYLPEAFRIYSRILSSFPSEIKARKKRAELAIYFRDWSCAEKDIKQLRKTALNDPEVARLAGDLAAAKGDLTLAEKAYRKAITLTKPDHKNRLLMRLAFCALGQGRQDDAIHFLKRLRIKQGLPPELLKDMSDFNRLLSRYDEAEKLLRQAITLAPENISLQLDLALLYLETEAFSKAENILEKILERDPANRFAKKILFEILLEQQKFEQFQVQFNGLTSEEKHDIEFLLLLAKKNLATAQFLRAISSLQEVVEKEPDLALAHYLLGIAYLATGHENLGKNSLVKSLMLNKYFADANLALADFYLKTYKPDIAKEYAQRVLETEPLNFRAMQIKALAMLHEKKPEKALKQFRTVEILTPGRPANTLILAQIAITAGKPEQALAIYEDFLKASQLKLDIVREYLELLISTGSHKKTAKVLKTLEHKYPENPWLLTMAAEYWIKLGRQEQAIANLEHVLTIDPSIQAPYVMLAQLYMNDPAKMEKILNELITRFPGHIEGYQQLAGLYLDIGFQEKAVELLEKALSIKPNDPLVNSNLAWLYSQHEDKLDEAMPLAMKAFESAPDDPAVQDTMAWIYYRKGLSKRALWILEELAQKHLDDPRILYHLGLVQLSADPALASEGEKNIKKALSLCNNPALADEIRKSLVSLKTQTSTVSH